MRLFTVHFASLVYCNFAVFREVWPGVEFGSSGMAVDEEMDGVRDILLNTAVGGLKLNNNFFGVHY